MEHVIHLECTICGREYQPDEIDYICPEHGNEGILDVVYDYDWIASRLSQDQLAAAGHVTTMWRYKALLPVEPRSPVPELAVGWTPMFPVSSLKGILGLPHVWLKDEGRQPTGSLKDRASAVAVVKARERGADIATTASTGNAAAALAGLCASVQMASVIFVPESAPSAKVAQLVVYGSTVLLIRGNYDQAFDLCLQAATEFGWYNRNTGFNPYMSEGKKTAGYEICEQLNWEAPDVVFVSVGDGCIIGGLYKGFKDLRALGWIQKMPRLIGVQAAGSSFMRTAWEKGEDVLVKAPINARTIADSICTGLPRDRIKAMAAVRETGGAFLSVSDERILAAIPAMARCAGVFAEPAGAAAYAGLEKAVEKRLVDPQERIVVLNTGNGLKDVPSASKAAEIVGSKAHRLEPKMDGVRRVVEGG